MVRTKNTNNKSGLAAVEMALLLPIFMLLMMGVMDAARLHWTQSVVRDAAFEGARMAILHEPTAAQIETIVVKEVVSGGLESTVSVVVGERVPAQPVNVTVAVPFEFLVLGSIIPSMAGDKPVTATAVMTHER